MYLEPQIGGETLRRRFEDTKLRDAVDEWVGGVPEPVKTGPRAWLPRLVATPNFELMAALDTSDAMGLPLVYAEYRSDRFTPHNPGKAGLAKLIFEGRVGKKETLVTQNKTIADFNRWAGKPVAEMVTNGGESLVAFHHRLLRAANLHTRLSLWQSCEWYKHKGSGAAAYYPYFLALGICHCAILDIYLTEGEEAQLTERVVMPALEQVKKRFGLEPVIVPHLPLNDAFNPHWDRYPLSLKEHVDSPAGFCAA